MGPSVEMIGVLHPKAYKVARVKQLFSDLTKAVATQEEGCQVYDVYTQTRRKDISRIIFHKRCVDQNALNVHLQSDHLMTVASALAQKDLLPVPLEVDNVFVERISGHSSEQEKQVAHLNGILEDVKVDS